MVLSRPPCAQRAASAASQRPVPTSPPLQPLPGRQDDEASTEGSLAFARPRFPSPVVPGESGNPSALALGLRTPQLPATHAEVGTDHRALARDHVTTSSSSSST